MRHSLRTFQASLLALVLGLVPASGAIMQTFIFNSGFQNGGSIPDGDPTGVVDARVITSSITNIDEISVSLDIGGTWAGDIYATLQHDSGFSVLLNRVGRSGTSSFGSSDDGFDVTLNDSGGHPDVHLQSSGGGPVAPDRSGRTRVRSIPITCSIPMPGRPCSRASTISMPMAAGTYSSPMCRKGGRTPSIAGAWRSPGRKAGRRFPREERPP